MIACCANVDREISRGSNAARSSAGAFFGVCGLLCAASTIGTVVWCNAMTGMGGMSMPGGWTMAMTWMRMPGQTWLGAAATFLAMWMMMMAAMMLPSVAPILWRARRAFDTGGAVRPDLLAGLMGAGYFAVWAAIGLAVFSVGVALAAVEMQIPTVSRAVPLATGVVVTLAGGLQVSAWKQRALICCRDMPPYLPPTIIAAWRCGLTLGRRCGLCCANLTAILLVIDVMDLGAMVVVTAAITAERLSPESGRVVRGIGLAMVVVGLVLIARGFNPLYNAVY